MRFLGPLSKVIENTDRRIVIWPFDPKVNRILWTKRNPSTKIPVLGCFYRELSHIRTEGCADRETPLDSKIGRVLPWIKINPFVKFKVSRAFLLRVIAETDRRMYRQIDFPCAFGLQNR
ncbi:hypothetical protein J6590_016390 [Homalodisca vitripennis]|nr:hypothetical protein J6590_016390 [Homalodisca vitripennis]